MAPPPPPYRHSSGQQPKQVRDHWWHSFPRERSRTQGGGAPALPLDASQYTSAGLRCYCRELRVVLPWVVLPSEHPTLRLASPTNHPCFYRSASVCLSRCLLRGRHPSPAAPAVAPLPLHRRPAAAAARMQAAQRALLHCRLLCPPVAATPPAAGSVQASQAAAGPHSAAAVLPLPLLLLLQLAGLLPWAGPAADSSG